MNVLGLSTSTQCPCRVVSSQNPGRGTPEDGKHECPCKYQPSSTKVQKQGVSLLFGVHSFGVTGTAPFAPLSLLNLSWKLCCEAAINMFIHSSPCASSCPCEVAGSSSTRCTPCGGSSGPSRCTSPDRGFAKTPRYPLHPPPPPSNQVSLSEATNPTTPH